MTREKLQSLILQDDLRGIIDILLTEPAKSNVAKSLNGRLLELNKQNNLGTIGMEAYNIERNRIRASLINLAENDTPTASEHSTKLLHKVGAFLLIPILIGGLLYAFYAKSNATTVEASKNELAANDTIATSKDTIAPPIVVKPPIKINSITSPINYQLENLYFNTPREYRKGFGYLKIRYDWYVDVPVSVRPEDVKMEYSDSLNTLNIDVQKVVLSTSFHIKKKKAHVLKNSLWIEPKSEDGKFWEKLNPYAKSRLSGYLKGNKKYKTKIQSYFERQLIAKAQQLNPELDIDKTTFEVNFGKFQLYNNGFVGF